MGTNQLETFGYYNIRERFTAIRDDKSGNAKVYDTHKSTAEPIYTLDVSGGYFSFEPFRVWDEEEERWRFYALYTPVYLNVNLLDLETGEILGTNSDYKYTKEAAERVNKFVKPEEEVKEGDSNPSLNFCIADLHVPDFFDIHPLDKGTPDDYEGFKAEMLDHSDFWGEEMDVFLSKRTFGFVAGCVWGDDYLFKLQTINLERISEGEIELEETFGYFPIMGQLKDVYNPTYFEDESRFLDLKAIVGFEMKKRGQDEKKREAYVHYVLPDDVKENK